MSRLSPAAQSRISSFYGSFGQQPEDDQQSDPTMQALAEFDRDPGAVIARSRQAAPPADDPLEKFRVWEQQQEEAASRAKAEAETERKKFSSDANLYLGFREAGYSAEESAMVADRPARDFAHLETDEFRQFKRLAKDEQVAELLLPKNPYVRAMRVGADSAVGSLLNGMSYLMEAPTFQTLGITSPEEVAASKEKRVRRGEFADEQAHLTQVLGETFAQRAVRNTAHSLGMVAGGSLIGGPYGAIGAMAASSFESAERDADKAGLTGLKRHGYIIGMAGTETAITLAFSALGFGGLEGPGRAAAQGVIRRTFLESAKQGLKTIGRTNLEELPEELLIATVQSGVQTAYGMQEPSLEQFGRTLADTTAATVLGSSIAGGARHVVTARHLDHLTPEGRKNVAQVIERTSKPEGELTQDILESGRDALETATVAEQQNYLAKQRAQEAIENGQAGVTEPSPIESLAPKDEIESRKLADIKADNLRKWYGNDMVAARWALENPDQADVLANSRGHAKDFKEAGLPDIEAIPGAAAARALFQKNLAKFLGMEMHEKGVVGEVIQNTIAKQEAAAPATEPAIEAQAQIAAVDPTKTSTERSESTSPLGQTFQPLPPGIDPNNVDVEYQITPFGTFARTKPDGAPPAPPHRAVLLDEQVSESTKAKRREEKAKAIAELIADKPTPKEVVPARTVPEGQPVGVPIQTDPVTADQLAQQTGQTTVTGFSALQAFALGSGDTISVTRTDPGGQSQTAVQDIAWLTQEFLPQDFDGDTPVHVGFQDGKLLLQESGGRLWTVETAQVVAPQVKQVPEGMLPKGVVSRDIDAFDDAERFAAAIEADKEYELAVRVTGPVGEATFVDDLSLLQDFREENIRAAWDGNALYIEDSAIKTNWKIAPRKGLAQKATTAGDVGTVSPDLAELIDQPIEEPSAEQVAQRKAEKPLEEMGVRELKPLAKSMGLANYSNVNKAGLLEMIRAARETKAAAGETQAGETPVKTFNGAPPIVEFLRDESGAFALNARQAQYVADMARATTKAGTRFGATMGSWFRRNFRSDRNLPDGVWDADRATAGAFAAEKAQTEFYAKDLKEMKPESWSRQERADFNAAMNGDHSAMLRLPPEIKNMAKRGRNHIAQLTQMRVALGISSADEISSIQRDGGIVLHKGYRALDNAEKWKRQFEDDPNRTRIINQFIAHARTKFPSYNAQQLDTLVTDILANPKTGLKPFQEVAGTPNKPMSFAKLLDGGIDAPVRALLGEYGDAEQNYVRTALDLAHGLSKGAFQAEMLARGKGKWLFDSKDAARPAEFNLPVDGLPGMLTSKPVKEALEMLNDSRQRSVAEKVYLRALGEVKANMTTRNPVSWAHNITSGLDFIIANRITPTALRDAWAPIKAHLFQTKKGRAELDRYIRLNIIDQHVIGGEVSAYLKNADFKGDLGDMMEGVFDRWQSANEGLARAYSGPDNLFRIAAFETTLKRYREAYAAAGRKISNYDLEHKVAKIIRDTMPSYGELPQIVRTAAAATPITRMGMFVSWNAEVLRTFYHQIGYSFEEMADPATRSLGAARLIGVTGATLGPPVVLGTTAALVYGVTAAMTGAIREMAREWDKKGTLIPVSRPKDGKATYVNISRSFAYSLIKDAASNAWNADNWWERVTAVPSTLLGSFAEQDALGQATSEWMNNRDSLTGDKIVRDDMTAAERSEAAMKHFAKVGLPGIVKNIERAARKGTPVEEAVANVTGFRVVEIDSRKEIQSALGNLRENRQEIGRALSRGLQNAKPEDIGALYRSLNEKLKATQLGVHRKMEAAVTLGVPREEVTRMLKQGGVSEIGIEALSAGETVPITVDASDIRRIRAGSVNPDVAARKLSAILEAEAQAHRDPHAGVHAMAQRLQRILASRLPEFNPRLYAEHADWVQAVEAAQADKALAAQGMAHLGEMMRQQRQPSP